MSIFVSILLSLMSHLTFARVECPVFYDLESYYSAEMNGSGKILKPTINICNTWMGDTASIVHNVGHYVWTARMNDKERRYFFRYCAPREWFNSHDLFLINCQDKFADDFVDTIFPEFVVNGRSTHGIRREGETKFFNALMKHLQKEESIF